MPQAFWLQVPGAIGQVQLLRAAEVWNCKIEIFRKTPARSGMDRRPGRIECMSSQRRESRWQRNECANREGADGRRSPAPVTRFHRATASDGTARPDNSALLVTNSLQKDLRVSRIVSEDSGSWLGIPGPAVSTCCTLAEPARSSLLPISFLSGSARIQVTLPQAPAGTRRWAERYDGKGNLYFKHAA